MFLAQGHLEENASFMWESIYRFLQNQPDGSPKKNSRTGMRAARGVACGLEAY